MEHAAVSAWVEEAFGSLSRHNPYVDVELKTFPSGQRLLDGKPEQSRRYLLAAVEQVWHWDRQTDRILPGWGPVEGRGRLAAGVVAALMRRALPLEKPDLIAILRWCQEAHPDTVYLAPIGPITKALERYAATTPIDPDLRRAIADFASQLRASSSRNANRLANRRRATVRR